MSHRTYHGWIKFHSRLHLDDRQYWALVAALKYWLNDLTEAWVGAQKEGGQHMATRVSENIQALNDLKISLGFAKEDKE